MKVSPVPHDVEFFYAYTYMDIVEKLMETRKWQNRCLRSNIVRPEMSIYSKKTKLAMVESNSPQPKKYKLDRALLKAIEDIAPEWWGADTRLCVNRNVQCERHKDGNEGHFYILWLGGFTGGALLCDDGTRIEEKYKWHKIIGQIHHWNEPHDGTKYSIIIYKGNGQKKNTDLINKLKKQTTDNTIDG